MGNVFTINKEQRKKKNVLSFLRYCRKLETVELIGVATLLKVRLLDDDGTERDGALILNDIIDNYAALPYSKQREFIDIVRKAVE